MISGNYFTIKKYILKEFLLSFLISFLFFFFIFFINQILLVAKNILIKNVSIEDLLRIIVYSVPIILAFTFPFATLSGASMALGRLSSDSELLAMRSGGISYKKILTPLITVAIIFSVVSFLVNDIFLPLSTIEYKKLYKELLYKSPALELGSFTSTKYGDKLIVNKQIEDEDILDIIIVNLNESYDNRTITNAEKAILKKADDENSFILELYDVQYIQSKSSSAAYDTFQADSMDLFFFMDSLSFNMLSTAPSEKSFLDVYSEIQEKQKTIQVNQIENEKAIALEKYTLFQSFLNNNFTAAENSYSKILDRQNRDFTTRTFRYYKIELFKKLSLPLGCLFLIFLSFPISTFKFQNGKLIGFGFGVILSTLYWVFLFLGQTYGVKIDFSPFLLMFLPNFFLGTIGLLVFSILKNR
ncbi:MAG: LptF/LptG family permease [Spirochaetia bacterium]|nr:LptF/LptG family permease [Spirochaetia bacterium]